jgi:hypothetical protein
VGQIFYQTPGGKPEDHPQHNHWHQSGVARFEVRKGTLDGPLVNNGVKITFCLVDTDQTDLVTKGSNRFYFDCNAALQGLRRVARDWIDEHKSD